MRRNTTKDGDNGLGKMRERAAFLTERKATLEDSVRAAQDKHQALSERIHAARRDLAEGSADTSVLVNMRRELVVLDGHAEDLASALAQVEEEHRNVTAAIVAEETEQERQRQEAATDVFRREADAALHDIAEALGVTLFGALARYHDAVERVKGYPMATQVPPLTYDKVGVEVLSCWAGPRLWNPGLEGGNLESVFRFWVLQVFAQAPGLNKSVALLRDLGMAA